MPRCTGLTAFTLRRCRPRRTETCHRPRSWLYRWLYLAATVTDVKNGARVVEVVAYDPAWLEQYRVEQRLLAVALPTALSIEHIGSTSIPGLAAKPIIDILVVVPEVNVVVAEVSRLEQLGYGYRPMAFTDSDHLFFVKDTAGKRSHHLHIFGVTSPTPDQNRLFRAYIAANPDVARRYEVAKRRAAELHPDSRAQYAAAKEETLMQLLAEAQLWGGSASGVLGN